MHANLHINAICRSQSRNAVGASAYRSGSAVTQRSAVACAAYRSGERIHDDRHEKTHDFSNKHNVMHAEIIAPENAPEWMKNRETLWNGVEAGEKRKDAQLAKEIILTLPRNLDLEQQKEVVQGFIKENMTTRGLVADYAIHSPEASDGERNPHAHIMFTLRPVDGDGFGKKLTGYNGLDGRDYLQELRGSYEKHLNQASQKAESEIRFDLRNLKEKGIDREPQPKKGPKVTHLEKRGYQTERGKEVRQVQHQNQAKAAQNSHNLFNTATYVASRAVDNVRDDVAHKYYEVMYGAQRAYGENENQRENDGYER